MRSRTSSESICSRRARDAEQAVVAQGVLGERHQLRGQHVLERHHAHLHALRPDEPDARGRAPGHLGPPGTDRLAVPIAEHAPDLALHGHAHAGTFSGKGGEVPVCNVSVPVMGEDWWVFEMSGPKRVPSEVR